jgi:hypothetical protein
MFVINNQQMKIFGGEVQTRFANDLQQLLLTNYPRECRQAGGKQQIGILVNQGINAALALGYTSKQQVSIYIMLMFILGIDFSRDPQLPWVADLLAVGGIADPTMRLNNVFQETLDYLATTAGEQCERIVRAMLRIRAFDLNNVPSSSEGEWISDVCAQFNSFYPEKFNYQGEEATRLMIEEGIYEASQYGLNDRTGLFVFLELKFMLGSGFYHDPLHPWATAILQEMSITPANERGQRLYAQALVHLEQSLSSQ